MANAMRPNGFRPVRHLDGSSWNGATVPYLIDSGDGTATFVGDMLQHGLSSGAAGQIVGGLDCEGMPMAIQATPGTAGQDNVGVVVGFSVDPTNPMLRHRAANTNRIAYVVTDPSVVYEIQEDALGTPIAAASIGLAFTYVIGSGNTATGQSASVLDSSELSNTATFPLKLLGLSKRVGNRLNVDGAGVDAGVFDVALNTGVMMPNIAGV